MEARIYSVCWKDKRETLEGQKIKQRKMYPSESEEKLDHHENTETVEEGALPAHSHVDRIC